METTNMYPDQLDTRLLLSVLTAFKKGDFSVRMPADWHGMAGKIADTLNDIIETEQQITQEIRQVTERVGHHGQLAQRASLVNPSGEWRTMTESINGLIDDLAQPINEMARVIGSVAKGDLSQRISLEVNGQSLRGQFLNAATSANTMVERLSSFASEVTRVAREVGTEGKLGGQANVPDVAGTWKDLTDNVNEMIRNLKETTQKNAQQDWLKTNLARFTRLLQGQRDLEAVTTLILSELAPLVSAHHGVFYMMDKRESDARLCMIASYGYRSSRKLPTSFLPGEGLVGQCALEKQRVWLTDVPRDYIQISSGLGAAPPSNIVVLPILFEQQVKAVIEIASLDRFTETHLSFLDQLMESIGVVLNTIEATSRTESLLMQSQLLAQELQQTNLELAEKARLLSDQNIEVERKNREVEQAKLALEEKASQLALSSKYKSEFLANMSHELRTPLNSLLILAQQLADNPGSNLTEKQVEYAKTIHGSGSDLLTLINDILDLSKIESGTVTLELSEYGFRAMRSYVERTFRHMAEAKQLEFMVDMANTLPAALTTDITRLQQILKNLLSNAFKFTSRGSVTLKVEFAPNGWSNDHPELSRANAVLAFSVIDSGVGIPQDKLQLIFEAFQQADGSTARKYGGTGLGLSISRELSRLLGGEIRVVSEVGVGSTFTLYLPYNSSVSASGQPMIAPFHRVEQSVVPYAMAAIASFESAELQVQQNTVRDDRTVTISGDASILIVEGNAQFASQLLDFARANRFKGVIAASGESVLMLARDYLPSAIFLSLSLPDVEGFKVLERLKRDPNTRNIPVYVMSSTNGLAKDELAAERERSLRLGAVSYLSRPFSAGRIDAELARIEELRSSSRRSVLVVEKNGGRTGALFAALKAEDVEAVPAETADEAMELLNRRRFHCMAVDMDLPEAETVYLFDELLKSERHSGMAIIASSTIDLSRKQTAALKRAAKSLLVRESHGPAQLNEIAALLLHRLPPVSEVKNAAGVPVPAVEDLAGRKVLIVDDDLRNIFALSSALERYKMQVLFAENGRDGIEVLEKNPDIEIVLMDIMMPEMDGYDTMRAIRRIPRFKTLPIITLTAKAMKGDRDKCIAAGASDYITKPVDIAQLISMMRVWMEERQDAA